MNLRGITFLELRGPLREAGQGGRHRPTGRVKAGGQDSGFWVKG